MIPSSPETISATHVEYLPLSAAYIASTLAKACGHHYRMRVTDGGYWMPILNPSGQPTSEGRTRALGLPVTSHFANTFSHMLRGHDLHYAPHVHVPAAESVRNFSSVATPLFQTTTLDPTKTAAVSAVTGPLLSQQ